jgi:hypothetical protein
LHGSGCPKCAIENITADIKVFIEKAEKTHGKKYDYSFVEYKDSHTPVKIKCPVHGFFTQTPTSHIMGSNCPKCSKVHSYSTAEYIEKAMEAHGNQYDYSETIYNGTDSMVRIKCPIHSIFEQRAYNHMVGICCPKCNDNHMEKAIKLYLERKNIRFIRQYKFEDCINIRPLPFDFYLPELNITIEAQGPYHYEPIERMGGMEKFLKVQKNDAIKRNYCKVNNISFLEIKYDEDISEKLNGICAG